MAWTFLINLLTQVWQICNTLKKKLNSFDVWFLFSFDLQIILTFPLILILQRFSSKFLRLCPVLFWSTGGGHGWRFIPSLILILTEFRSGLSQCWACSLRARLTFHPRASINQRLATVAPLLPPSTSWGCADGDDGNHGDEDEAGDDDHDGDGGLACPMNKEKSGNDSKKPRTSSDCTCSSGSNALLALRPTRPTF